VDRWSIVLSTSAIKDLLFRKSLTFKVPSDLFSFYDFFYSDNMEFWVKEEWRLSFVGDYPILQYKAGGGAEDPYLGDGWRYISMSDIPEKEFDELCGRPGWNAANTMPRWAARLFLPVRRAELKFNYDNFDITTALRVATGACEDRVCEAGKEE